MHKKPWFRKRFQKHLTPEIEELMDQLESHYVVSPMLATVISVLVCSVLFYEIHQPSSFLRTVIYIASYVVMMGTIYLSLFHVTHWKNGFPPRSTHRPPDVVYGCRNRITAKTYMVQVGWTKKGQRILKEQPNVFAKDGIPCRYKDEHPNDPACRGCKHGAQAVKEDSRPSGPLV
ncbi:hypothetical protein [Acidithiobacillus sulfurivorans]|uniref:Uncharacterized protein n=1 Tax=Acidithiobacillus sulfurivorans TaxID=1958756 RepID=A0ABS6A2S6_9PROT|nr:hypothetical protein [Acidithiobacillus sulfurivorans]MBU2760950.1 hypothetical protein [Acidithiobacillus sulfurivorans]